MPGSYSNEFVQAALSCGAGAASVPHATGSCSNVFVQAAVSRVAGAASVPLSNVLSPSACLHEPSPQSLAPIQAAATAESIAEESISQAEQQDMISFADKGDFDAVLALMAAGVSPDEVNHKGDTVLMLAAAQGHLPTVQAILETHPEVDINELNQNGDTALRIAVSGGHINVVAALVKAGAWLEYHNYRFTSTLKEAMRAPDFALMVAFLLEAGTPDLNEQGNVAMQCAAYVGDAAGVSALLKAGVACHSAYRYAGFCVEPPIKGAYYPPIHGAAKAGHAHVVSQLLEAGAPLDAKAEGGDTPLSLAAGAGHAAVVSMLLERGAKAHVRLQGNRTPLMEAALNGSAPVVSALLAAGADIHAATSDGETASITAARRGHTEVASLLLDAGANLKAMTKEKDTPLFLAAHLADKVPLLSLLLSAGADVHATNKLKQTALMCAASAGNTSNAILLIEPGARVNVADNLGRTPLFFAANCGNTDIVARILQGKGVEVNAVYKDNETALHCAARRGHSAVVRLLLDAGANMETVRESGSTPLMDAVELEDTSTAHMLIQAGANVRHRGGDGVTLLTWAIFYSKAPPAERERLVRTLLEAGADVNACSQSGSDAVYVASGRQDAEELLSVLLTAGAELEQANDTGSTAFLAACQSGYPGRPYFSNIKFLLEAGACVNVANNKGTTALMTVVQSGHPDIVARLLEAPTLQLDAQEETGNTALIMAAGRGAHVTVRMLLEAGADVHVNNRSGAGPLHCAAQCPKATDVLSMLVTAGANLEHVDGSGDTALLRACKTRQPSIANITVLLDAGACVNAADNKGTTVLMLAVQSMQPDIVNRVLREPTLLLDAQDAAGDTALILAARTGRQPLLRMLLEAGANVNYMNDSGDTAVSMMPTLYKVPEVDGKHFLIEAGADVHKTNSQGKTPLALAVEQQQTPAIICLLAAGSLCS